MDFTLIITAINSLNLILELCWLLFAPQDLANSSNMLVLKGMLILKSLRLDLLGCFVYLIVVESLLKKRVMRK